MVAIERIFPGINFASEAKTAALYVPLTDLGTRLVNFYTDVIPKNVREARRVANQICSALLEWASKDRKVSVVQVTDPSTGTERTDLSKYALSPQTITYLQETPPGKIETEWNNNLRPGDIPMSSVEVTALQTVCRDVSATASQSSLSMV